MMEARIRFLGYAAAVAMATMACSGGDKNDATVKVTQLSAGDANCPNGGVAITVDGTTAYACNGATGAPGAPGAPGVQGGGLYTSKAALECQVSPAGSGLLVVDGWAIGAACTNKTDLPVTGACALNADPTGGVALVESGPANLQTGWFANLEAPAWACRWAFPPGTNPIPALPSATATVCCIKNP